MPVDFPNTLPELDFLQDAPEYYRAKAPDGTRLHGSSALKRYRKSPPQYFEQLAASITLESCKGGLGDASKRYAAEATLRKYEASKYQSFGSLVDAYLLGSAAEKRQMETSHKTVDLLRARQRAAAICSHPDVGPYVNSPTMRRQVAHAWQDPATGLWCRLRMDIVDYLDGRPSYLDLKVWSRSDPRLIWRNIKDFGVDIQVPLYRRGAVDLWGEDVGRRLRCGLIVCDPKERGTIYLRWIHDEKVDEWDEALTELLGRLACSYITGDFRDPDEGVAEIGYGETS